MVAGKFAVGTNRKLGSRVGSINRVSGDTCPAQTKWCSKFCYAKRGFFHFWEKDYASPLEMPCKLPEMLRFHSSGDFDSVKYIEWVKNLVEDYPNVKFWAYTKSWMIPELREALEDLKKCENIQLIASMDVSIEKPPEGWRVAWIRGDNRAEGIMCPHDMGLVDTCQECGYCFKDNKDVIFKFKSPSSFDKNIQSENQKTLRDF